MRTASAAAVIAAVGMAAGASAGPGAKATGKDMVRQRAPVVAPVGGGMGPDGGPFTDNFDTYANGSAIAPQGGWEVWYTGGGNGSVTNAQASSAPNSMSIAATSDVVQRFTVTDGKWIFKIKTFVPSSTPPGVGGYVILMNQYGGPDNWSVQVAFNDTNAGTTTIPFQVESQFDNATLPLLLDQWVEFRSEIDLVADQVTNFYNNQQLGLPHLWTDNLFASGPGITSIACVDLYSPAIGPMYFDDVSLTPNNPCYPDCNASGSLTVADFGCFQGKYVLGDLYADCNASGTLTVADFGCFQGKYVLGCP
ncbi:MAG: hypothetical protein ACKVU4_10430 [Phycisphaerales bacterium]